MAKNLCLFFYFVVCVSSIRGCDEFHTSHTGSISSPNYPSNYPGNSYCSYVIDVAGSSKLTVTFLDFALEPNFDFLYYGTGSVPLAENALGYLSQTNRPDPFDLPGPTIWFLFDSDPNVPYPGFLLEWEAQAARCSYPSSYPHASYSVDTTEYTVGTYVVYTCDLGYRMVGDADYIVHVCRSSDVGNIDWEGPTVQCDVLVCPAPSIPEQGSVTIASGTSSYEVGSEITYTCNSGFIIDGPSQRTCTVNASWSDADPGCIVDCSAPDSYQYDTNTCYVFGLSTRTRVDAYSTCTLLEPPYSDLAHIKDSDRQHFIEDIAVTKTPTNNYWIGGREGKAWTWENGGDNIIDFFWGPEEPNNVNGNEECINLNPRNGNNYAWNDESCTADDVPGTDFHFICQFGATCPANIIDGSNNLPNTQVTFNGMCIAFVTSKSDKARARNICINNGGHLLEIRDRALQDFIVDTLTAKVIGGELLEVFWWIGATADPNLNVWRWTDGSTIDTSFWAPDEPNNGVEECINLYHTLSYKWNDDGCGYYHYYICQIAIEPYNCGYPGAPTNGNSNTTTDDVFYIGDIIYFVCDPGYMMDGPSQITCQEDGVWSDDVPWCSEVVSCSEAELPVGLLPYGHYEVLSTGFRGVAVYHCNDETALLTGDPVVYCNEFAQWSALNATCPEITTNVPTTTANPTTIIPTTEVPLTTSVTTSLPTTEIPLTTLVTTSLPTTEVPLTTSATTDLPTTNPVTTSLTTESPWTILTDIFTTLIEFTTVIQTTNLMTSTIPATNQHQTEMVSLAITYEPTTIETPLVTDEDVETSFATTLIPSTSNSETSTEILTEFTTNLPPTEMVSLAITYEPTTLEIPLVTEDVETSPATTSIPATSNSDTATEILTEVTTSPDLQSSTVSVASTEIPTTPIISTENFVTTMPTTTMATLATTSQLLSEFTTVLAFDTTFETDSSVLTTEQEVTEWITDVQSSPLKEATTLRVVTPTEHKTKPEESIDPYAAIFWTCITLAILLFLGLAIGGIIHLLKKTPRVTPTDEVFILDATSDETTGGEPPQTLTKTAWSAWSIDDNDGLTVVEL